MVKHTFKIICVLLFLGAIIFESAEPATMFSDPSASTPSAGSINKLLELSGLTEQVEEFPGLIKAGINSAIQSGAPIPREHLQIMLETVDRTILPSIVLDQVRLSIEKKISTDGIKEIFKWHESSLKKRITQAEEKAAKPEAYREMMNSAQKLLKNTKRVAFAKRLDSMMNLTDRLINLKEFSGLIVFSAVLTAREPDKPLDIEAYKAYLKTMTAKTRDDAQQLVLISNLYTYQSIDEESLSEYEAFLNKPTTKRYNAAVMNGLDKGFELVITNCANEIAAALKAHLAKSGGTGAH